MSIIVADKSNLEDLVKLSLMLFPKESYEGLHKIYADIIDLGREVGLLYQKDDRFVGYMHLSIRNDYVNGTSSSPVAFVEAIFVLPEYRKCGIAREFIEYAEDFARKHNCKELASDCLTDNIDSENFHKSCGFIEKERVICLVKDVL